MAIIAISDVLNVFPAVVHMGTNKPRISYRCMHMLHVTSCASSASRVHKQAFA